MTYVTIRFRQVAMAGLLASGAASGLQAQDTLTQSLVNGTTNLAFRLRHEQVEDNAPNTAHANTLRTRLSYNSGTWRGLDLMLEMDNVSYLGDERFNNTRNQKIRYSTIPDPDGTDLNQAALRFRHNAIVATAGRQRLVRGNQRFIGSVGWRQNEQTFDALDVSWSINPELSLSYAWIDNTRRIFGPEGGNPPAALSSDHHLLDAAWTLNPSLAVAAYSYALDFANAAALSSRTTGIAINGKHELADAKVDWRLEAARQTDHGNNPVDFGANYSLGTVGITLSGIRAALSHETLGADTSANVAVQTPLATLHAFQGWADRFLTTPSTGIRNTSLSLGGALANINLLAIWHDYESDQGNQSLGHEWNLQASRNFAQRYTLTLKFADYQGSGGVADSRKLWAMVEARF